MKFWLDHKQKLSSIIKINLGLVDLNCSKITLQQFCFLTSYFYKNALFFSLLLKSHSDFQWNLTTCPKKHWSSLYLKKLCLSNKRIQISSVIEVRKTNLWILYHKWQYLKYFVDVADFAQFLSAERIILMIVFV